MRVELDLEKDELEFAYYQLVARSIFFNQEMKAAGERGDLKRVKEVSEAVRKLDKVMGQLLNKM